MMVRFFTHGDGSGRAAVEYLLAKEVAAYTEDRKRIAGETVRRDVPPEILAGDPDLTWHLIDSNTRKWRYTSGVVAFHADDDPSEAKQAVVMQDLEKAAFAGLETDQANILWVRHQHMGNIELHFLIPRVELYAGRSFNPAPPGSERFFNAFRDYWNAREGWVSPEEPERKRMIKPVFDLGDRKSIKETIQTLMLQKIEAGEVQNHADVRAVLATLDGLEFKPLTKKQLEKRRKADAEEAKDGKPRRRDTRITMRLAGTSNSQNTFRLEDRIFHETWTADEYFAAKPASEVGDAKPRHRRADPAVVERLRAAFVTSVERRAAKNRDRYARPRKTEQLDQQPDGPSDRCSGQQHSGRNGGVGREQEGMAHGDVEDDAADLPSRGLSDLLGTLDGSAADLSGATISDRSTEPRGIRSRWDARNAWPWRAWPGGELATWRRPRELPNSKSGWRRSLRRNSKDEVAYVTPSTDALRDSIIARCRRTEHDIRGWVEERGRFTERIGEFTTRVQTVRKRIGSSIEQLGEATDRIVAAARGLLSQPVNAHENLRQEDNRPDDDGASPFLSGPTP
ncbi:relaxase/mobilization nuclease domain-containing protein [Yoonia maricola]|uniref:relaxase/mobilization nuclease domain-containing protein n=1 Tax=Yoonia maricola TaxID=420999 RepID=UPI000C24AEE9|nr:relaxase/mobilization nuclease domain-containing protein [Yoonia maricola]